MRDVTILQLIGCQLGTLHDASGTTIPVMNRVPTWISPENTGEGNVYHSHGGIVDPTERVPDRVLTPLSLDMQHIESPQMSPHTSDAE